MHKLTRITAAVLLSLSMASTGMLTAYADETTAAPATLHRKFRLLMPLPILHRHRKHNPRNRQHRHRQMHSCPRHRRILLCCRQIPCLRHRLHSPLPIRPRFLIPMRKRLSELLSRRLKTVKPYLILQAAYARLISTGHLPLLPMTPCITMETAGTPCR